MRYQEKVYGDLATVFHRTSAKDLIDRVYTSGFKPSTNAMYGKGFYGTYDLESQEKQNMSDKYGNIIVKFSVSISDFIIFDEEEFQKTSNYKTMMREEPDAQFLVWQFEDFSGHNLNENTRKKILDFYDKNPVYTADLAENLWKEIYHLCNGIIFTGRQDGKVLVCYEPNLIIPLSFRIDGERDFKKANTNLEYLSNYVDTKFDIHVQNDYNLTNQGLKELPFGINKSIIGDFSCDNNNLISLKGAPKEVDGDFSCIDNNLTSLKGSPKEVGGGFYCDYNNLTSLEGSPLRVGGDFSCNHNNLASLENCPKEVGGDFYCYDNKSQFTIEDVKDKCKVKRKIYI